MSVENICVCHRSRTYGKTVSKLRIVTVFDEGNAGGERRTLYIVWPRGPDWNDWQRKAGKLTRSVYEDTAPISHCHALGRD